MSDLFGSSLDEGDETEEGCPDYARLGRYVEFIVCAELTKLGYFVTHCDAPGFDILLVASGKPLRVQVKSSHKIENGKCVWRTRVSDGRTQSKARIKRPITTNEADILALYHHAFEQLIFVAVRDASAGYIELPIAQVKASDSAKSLVAALRR